MSRNIKEYFKSPIQQKRMPDSLSSCSISNNLNAKFSKTDEEQFKRKLTVQFSLDKK